MMPVSLKIQKILMIIPGLNMVCLPIGLYNICYYGRFRDARWKVLFIAFTSAVPLFLLDIFVSDVIPGMYDLSHFLIGYILPFLIAFRLIHYQEKLK